MDDSRLVQTVLRCYPAHWRRRHGDEAAELAALLIRDGASATSIAWSYLTGAAREWLTPRPGRPLSTMACALLVAACSLAVSVGLLTPAVAARAAARTPATQIIPVPAPSQPRQSAPCQPGTSAPTLTPVMNRPQLIIREAWHGRSC